MTLPGDQDPARHSEVEAALGEVRARIDAACAAAGREPADVTLVVVTKTRPASDVRLLVGLGVTDVGENRDQEARPKAEACADLAIRWHFVGQLQTNKARSVARYADFVHSVDRPSLVGALDRAAESASRRVGCLVQVALAAGEGRGGADPAELPALADAVAAAGRLDLLGVMAVAPLVEDPRAAFDRLAGIAQRLRADHPSARWVSAGMTQDLEQAIAAGATHVRVGSAILVDDPRSGSLLVDGHRRRVIASSERAPGAMAGALRKMGVYLGLVEDDPERYEEYDEYDEYDAQPGREAAPARAEPARTLHPVRDDRPHPAAAVAAPAPRPAPRPDPVESYKITTLHPRNYNDARTVGEYFRDGTPVIMNLTDMDDSDAKRLVDFSAGLIFGLHGTIERVTAKVFLLSPANVVVTAEEKARLAEGGFFNQS